MDYEFFNRINPKRTFGGFRFALAVAPDRSRSALDLLDTPDPLATCQGLGAPISNSCRARLRAAVRMNSCYQRGLC
jgi:hypothetical protein